MPLQLWKKFVLLVRRHHDLRMLRGLLKLVDQQRHVRGIEAFGGIIDEQKIEFEDVRLEAGEDQVRYEMERLARLAIQNVCGKILLRSTTGVTRSSRAPIRSGSW